MARQRIRRATGAARRGYGKFRGSRMGRRFNFRKVGAGAAANIGARVGAQYLGPSWGPAAGMMAAGVLLQDETAQFMAGMALGSNVPLGSFGASQPSGGYL
jgi:hypothetical protein